MAADDRYLFPPELFYDRSTHLWVRAADQTLTIGLDPLGLESLGDMAYISLEPVGRSVRRGEALGTLEAAKMVGDLIAPVSGTLADRNEAVLLEPGLVNRDPYGKGWLIKLTPADWTLESAELVHGAGLSEWVEAEIERYQSQGWIE